MRKRLPAGLDPNHPRVELLKHDGLVAVWESPLTPEVHMPGFSDQCVEHAEAMIPLAIWLSEHVLRKE
jgi:hypothetical protein